MLIPDAYGDYYEVEDSPVGGGFSVEFARQIANELQQAADWLEKTQ